MTGCVTIEWSVGLVRLHDASTKFGEHSPYSGGFVLIQTEPEVFEARLFSGNMTQAQRRDLRRQLEAIGAQAVYYWRYKEGREPYKVWITRRDNAQFA